MVGKKIELQMQMTSLSFPFRQEDSFEATFSSPEAKLHFQTFEDLSLHLGRPHRVTVIIEEQE